MKKYSYVFEMSKSESSYGRPQVTLKFDENGSPIEDFVDPTTDVGYKFLKLVMLNIMVNLEFTKDDSIDKDDIERFLVAFSKLDALLLESYSQAELLALESSPFKPHVPLTISFDGSNPPLDYKGFLSQADFLKVDFTEPKTIKDLENSSFKLMAFLRTVKGYGPGISMKVSKEAATEDLSKGHDFFKIALRNGVLLIDKPISEEEYIKIKELNDTSHQLGVIQCSLD